ncbi:MAG: DUF1289 domain-containing protein [Pseudomonadota bacterium]
MTSSPDTKSEQAIAPVESPCALVCSIDQETGWCYGCARTVDEIMAWIDMSEAERAELVAKIPERMKNMNRPARKLTKRRELKRQRTRS